MVGLKWLKALKNTAKKIGLSVEMEFSKNEISQSYFTPLPSVLYLIGTEGGGVDRWAVMYG